MKKSFLIYLMFAICTVLPLIALAEETPGEEDVLGDMERLRGVHQIARLIEAYYDKTGFYPGTKGWEFSEYGQLFVRITDQEKLPIDFFSISAVAKPAYPSNQLLTDLRKVLGNDVGLPYDKRPAKKQSSFCPTYYSYTWDGQCYYVTAYMDFPYRQTRKIGTDCYGYMVSSCENESKKIRKFKGIDPDEKLIPLTEEQN